MAHKGAFLGKAYTEEIGMVYVFADDDNKDMFFTQSTRGSATRYLARARVHWRK